MGLRRVSEATQGAVDENWAFHEATGHTFVPESFTDDAYV